jgi:formylglycine-generating enzyme required for sulfatase activity
MTKIPAGEFILGSDSENPIAHDDEYTTERKIYLPTYTIAIYPTTNAEFQCFINSGGYKEDQWWDPQGVKWKRGEIAITNSAAIRSWLGFIKYLQELTPGQLSLQRHWNPMQTQYWDSILKLSDVEIQNYAKDIFDRPFECPAFWKDREFNNLSKPIVGVNWYEADAYCRWLSASTNRHFHLPTEMEWEKAARGIDGKEYPWGDKFDPVSCNTLEGRVMSTTPVGLYLQGKSPFGLYDVSGNVWEWTSSFYLPYPGGNSNTFKETEATFHVLRGGGWNSSGIYARSGFREDASSDIFDLTIGFRVACDE